MSDSVGTAILNRLPDRFLAEPLARVNGDVEILALNIVKRVHVLLRWIASFFTRQIQSDDAPLPKIPRQFRHFERHVHISHRTNDQSGTNPKIMVSARQSLQHCRNDLLLCKLFLRMENRRESSFEINHSILA